MELDGLRRDNLDVRSELAVQAAEKVLEGVEKDLSRARTSARLQKQHLQETYDTIATLQKNSQRLQHELEEVKEELDKERGLRLDHELELRVMSEHKSEVAETEVARMAAMYMDVQVERDTLVQANIKLKKEVVALQAELEECRGMSSEASIIVQGRDEDMLGLQQKIKDLERHCRMLEQSQCVLSSQARNRDREEENAQRVLKETAARENAALRLVEVNTRCLELQNENARLRAHINMLERREELYHDSFNKGFYETSY